MSEEAVPDENTMRVDPQRAQVLAENLGSVLKRIDGASAGRKVRLIAVSKLKPANDILALHQAPHHQSHFGENYAQELTEKANLLPKTIKWHMIGALQTNKCKPLAEQVPNLWCVSSVDSTKKADQLEKGRVALEEKQQVPEKLRVLAQVNTSGEGSKSGVEPKDTSDLCRHIIEQCPHLQLGGFMTIGAIARSQETTPETENEDFVTLRDTRDNVARDLGLNPEELELSIGMSSDFEGALKQGSNEVRIGTTIFGQRPARKDAKIKADTTEEKA